jgi:hypothetical protein
MSKKYYLDGHNVVETDDIRKWAHSFEGTNRVVAKTELEGAEVSTVFLGIDHQFEEGGPPLLFETMVFGGPHDQEQERYSTWEEAEAGHARMVEHVKGETKP